MTTEQQIQQIEDAATSAFGRYSPIAAVECPHCGGIMAAIDAKAHVFTAGMTADEIADEAAAERRMARA